MLSFKMEHKKGDTVLVRDNDKSVVGRTQFDSVSRAGGRYLVGVYQGRLDDDTCMVAFSAGLKVTKPAFREVGRLKVVGVACDLCGTKGDIALVGDDEQPSAWGDGDICQRCLFVNAVERMSEASDRA